MREIQKEPEIIKGGVPVRPWNPFDGISSMGDAAYFFR